MEILFVWLLLAVGVGFLADSRGRSGFGYFLFSVVLSPLIGLVVVLVTDNLTKKKELAQAEERQHERRLEEVKAITASGSAAKAQAHTGSVADELVKLADLKTKGILTEDEFAAQKALLLGAAPPVVAHASSSNEPAVRHEGPQGVCPSCKAHIPLSSEDCPKCNASFGVGSAWKVRPL